MLNPAVNIADVPQAIQLALGPVFLLTGIAGVLNVMTGRLARIIDRGRQLSEGQGTAGSPTPEVARAELQSLERRREVASAAITTSTLAALLVCMVIAALFLGELLDVPLKWPVGVLFTGATLALVVGLAFFLREVQLATSSVRLQSRSVRD
jgi:Protein of unknown function (DUF2721)